MKSELTIRSPKEITQSPDILALIGKWHAALDRRVGSAELTANTAAVYKRGFGKFIDWIDDQQLQAVEPDTIRDWIAYMKGKEYKPGSINTWLAGVKAFFRWAVEVRLTAYNPADSVKGASRRGATQHRRELLTDDEVRRLLAMPDAASAVGVRDLAILAIFVYTGVRTVEIHRANLDNLRTQNRQLVLYVQGKGRAEADESVVITAGALRELYAWLAIRGDKPGALFTSLSNRSRGDRLSLR
ncbi:MAG: hypothetical protein DRO87_11285, partial [Candidatus Thorarchaeota archaeon]